VPRCDICQEVATSFCRIVTRPRCFATSAMPSLTEKAQRNITTPLRCTNRWMKWRNWLTSTSWWQRARQRRALQM
jgi:hypothetical protein